MRQSVLAAALALLTIAPATAQTLGARIQAANEQLLNRGDMSTVQELIAPNYVVHVQGMDLRGPDAIRGFVTELRTAFPDLHVEVQVLMETGDRAAWLRIHRGTQRGAYAGVPASGHVIEWHDMVVSRYDAGKIVEEWAVTDLGERLRAAR